MSLLKSTSFFWNTCINRQTKQKTKTNTKQHKKTAHSDTNTSLTPHNLTSLSQDTSTSKDKTGQDKTSIPFNPHYYKKHLIYTRKNVRKTMWLLKYTSEWKWQEVTTWNMCAVHAEYTTGICHALLRKSKIQGTIN